MAKQKSREELYQDYIDDIKRDIANWQKEMDKNVMGALEQGNQQEVVTAFEKQLGLFEEITRKVSRKLD